MDDEAAGSGSGDDRNGTGPGQGPWRTFLFSAVAVVLVLAAIVVPRATRDDDPGPYAPDSLEHRLAVSDGVRTAEVELRGYTDALTVAGTRCTGSPEPLAARALQARDALAERGAQVTSRDVLVSVGRDGGERGACDGAFDEAVQRLARCEPQGARSCGY